MSSKKANLMVNDLAYEKDLLQAIPQKSQS